MRPLTAVWNSVAGTFPIVGHHDDFADPPLSRQTIMDGWIGFDDHPEE